MLRLVEPDASTTRKLDPGNRPPPRFFHFRAPDPFGAEGHDLRIEVVTHEVQLMSTVVLRRMNGDLGGRQREDEPIMTGIHGGIAEYVSKERSIGRGVFAVDDYVRTEDHRCMVRTDAPGHPITRLAGRAPSACGRRCDRVGRRPGWPARARPRRQ